MLVENQEGSAESHIEDLFGPPPLIRGEDAARYWRLHAAVTYEIKPEMVLDKVLVREFVDKMWQQQRYKQNAASIVEGAYIEALASLLRPFIAPTFPNLSFGEEAAATTAREYYNGEAKPKKMEEIDSLLAQYGITEEQIRAKAMQLCGPAISMFNRMEASCETSLRMIRKENDRRTENAKARGSDETEGEVVK
jgi:hypothetical protein